LIEQFTFGANPSTIRPSPEARRVSRPPLVLGGRTVAKKKAAKKATKKKGTKKAAKKAAKRGGKKATKKKM
jgi:hypothetical protein